MTHSNRLVARNNSCSDNGWIKIPWKKLFIPYLLAFGMAFFIMNAIFWDDWTIVNRNDTTILETFRDAGTIFSWVGYFHVAMLKVGPSLYRVLTLILGFCSGLLLWLLTATIKELTTEERYWLTTLFLVLPFNSARFALINTPYILCLFVFFLAWYLLVARRGLFSKSLSLALFLFSFNTNSLLVFYLLPIAHAVWLFSEPKWRSVARWSARNFLFVIAPLFFFWCKTRYFKPTGAHIGYNSISLKLMLVALLPLPVMALGYYWTNKHLDGGRQARRWFLFVSFGIFATWLAVFPYLSVGLVPSFSDWGSRHQLLMSLGSAFILVGAGLYIGNLKRFCSIAATISILFCIYFMSSLTLDWWKQKKVIDLLSQSNDVKSAKTIVMVDKTKIYNAFNRTYRFYEYSGWMKKCFGDETRFAVNDFELESLASFMLPDNYKKFINPLYITADYVWSKPDLVVTIRHNGIKGLLRGDAFKIVTEKLK